MKGTMIPVFVFLLLAPSLLAQEDIGPGKFSIEKKGYKASEGTPESIKIIRTFGHDGAVAVKLSATGGSALSAVDYKPFDQVILFADGEESKSVNIEVLSDRSLELPESILLSLSEPEGGAVLGQNPTSKVTIASINNDAVILGILFIILALVFHTSSSTDPRCVKFYKVVPSLLLVYFLPSIFTTLGIFSAHHSKLYFVASRYLLPACLVLLCLSVDIKGIKRLGFKAIIMFLTGTFGVIIGGPLALLIVGAVSPETVGGEGANAVWRGMTTVAGSWIGGGANQAAMKEVFHVGGQIFSATVTVDIIVANLWMAVLLFMAGDSDKYDAKLKADNSAIKALQTSMADYQKSISKIPTLTDLMRFCGAAFAITGLAHFCADMIGPWVKYELPTWVSEYLNLNSTFFWLVVIATLGGLTLSFTRARKWEGVGASRVGSGFLYVLVATIGMEMDLTAIFHYPGLFVVGAIWILFHGGLLILMARLIHAPLFFLAIGSQANIGGAASAPIVASAFHPSLAPVGVMLAVLGYVVGTFGAWLCGLLMQLVAG